MRKSSTANTRSADGRSSSVISRGRSSTPIWEERVRTTAEYHGRVFTPRGASWYIEQRFFARDTERIYGLGQRQHERRRELT